MNIKQNYFFRSRRAKSRYLIFPVYLQISSTVLFVLLAILFSYIGFEQRQVVISSLSIIIIITLVVGFILHRRDWSLLRRKIWPLDSPQDSYDRLYEWINRLDQDIDKVNEMRKILETRLIENIQLRKKANTKRMTWLLPELNQLYKSMLDIRREGKDLLVKLANARENAIEGLSLLERDYDIDVQSIGDLSNEVNWILSSSSRIRQVGTSVIRRGDELGRQVASA